MTESRTGEIDPFHMPESSLKLLDYLLEGYQIIDSDWRYRYVNDAAAKHGKMPKKELIGKTMMEVYPGIEDTAMFDALRRCMEEKSPQRMENEFSFADGSTGWFELRFEPIPEGTLILSQDITERKRFEDELAMNVEVLELINAAESREAMLSAVLGCLQKWSRCEAVGIRLREGPDFPYFETSGFTAGFVEKERYLCQYDRTGKVIRDDAGEPILECMCGNIISGRFDPSKSFFTSDGSFWSNCTTELLATTTDAERQARTRNRCNSVGYESVALIPLRSGRETFGLIQLNDKQQGRFTAELVGRFRRIADHVAAYLAKNRAEEALLKSEHRFRLMAETIDDVFWLSTRGVGKMIYVSPAYENLWERSCESLYRSPRSFLKAVHPEDVKDLERVIVTFHKNGQPYECEYRIIRKNGEVRWIHERGFPVVDSGGEDPLMTGICSDITQRKHTEEEKHGLEEQFQQAQKMEAVGRLAGGVAHDYNNTLSVIIGYSELAMHNVGPEDPLWRDLKEIHKAADRSKDITRQLLAFARKETIAPEILDLNATVENMLKILRKLIGEDIDLVWHPGKVHWPVLIDPSQLDQILANLCVNARDAITDVGKITIETDTTTIDEEYCSEHAGFIPGDFVLLTISDDGYGMDRETMDNIFEPYFTTKDVGKGTGLGLSTVYGIVKQNNGFINVYSEPGRGTSFRIYLPRQTGDISGKQRTNDEQAVNGNGETVLVVEDEKAISKLAERILSRRNYKVLSAKSPSEAIEVAKAHSGEISLLITDVVLPEMNGLELSEQLKIHYPGIKCLFMSGYTANVIVHRGVLGEGIQFIQKPFSTKGLAVKVREALDQKAE